MSRYPLQTPKSIMDLHRYINQQDTQWSRIAYDTCRETMDHLMVINYLSPEEMDFLLACIHEG